MEKLKKKKVCQLKGSHIVSRDRKKDSSVLKRMRQEIGQVLRTEELEEAVCKTLGYTNLYGIEAECKGQVNVS